MRAAFVLLVVVAVGAFAWWLLGRPAGTPRPAGVGTVGDAEPAGTADAPTSERPAEPTLPARTEIPARTTAPKTVPVPVEGKGALTVVLVPPEGETAPIDAKIDLERIGGRLSAYPLPIRQEDGTWKYAAVPAGSYRVWVLSPGWRDASVETTVAPDEEVRARVLLAPGATAKFRVSNWAGEEPPKFKLSVFDGRKLPVAASFQTPLTRVRVPAGGQIGGVAEGSLIGLKPGTYTLRATSEEGDTDESTFEARLGGDPPTVVLKLKR